MDKNEHFLFELKALLEKPMPLLCHIYWNPIYPANCVKYQGIVLDETLPGRTRKSMAYNILEKGDLGIFKVCTQAIKFSRQGIM